MEKVVQQIAQGLKEKNNLEIEVLCCQSKGERRVEEIKGVKVFRAKSFGVFWGMPISFDFFRLFKGLRDKYDLIDFHHPFPLGDLAIFLLKPKAKLIVHYHSDIVRQKILKIFYQPLIYQTLKRAQKILVSNPNLIQSSPFLRRFKEKCFVLPFGVDFQTEDNLDRDKIAELKGKYGDFVLFVGRLNYYKGVEYLIEAIRNIRANLIIIGEGKEEKKLKQRAKILGLENKVFFLPFQDKKTLFNFYRAAKVFVLPSIFRSEAFGIVLIEAMACKTPVISTELGTGTSWVNLDGKTGFVVPARDSKALSFAIRKILEDKKLAQEFSQNAQKRAREEFSLEKMLERIKEVYSEIYES
jgi:rhamnosyl/mannosyltransferase